MGSNGTAGREKHNSRPYRESFSKRYPRLARQVFVRDSYRCVYCCAPATQIDHVVPRSLGGEDHPSNLVAACRTCNSSRQNKPLAEWSRALGALLGLAPRTVARRVRRQLRKPIKEAQ